MTDSSFVILFLLTSGVAAVYEARKFRDHAEAFRRGEISSSTQEDGTISETISGMTYQTTGMAEMADYGPFTVLPHQLFLLSDNQSNTLVSRTFGTVSVGLIEGRVKARLWPRKRMGTMNRVTD